MKKIVPVLAAVMCIMLSACSAPAETPASSGFSASNAQSDAVQFEEEDILEDCQLSDKEMVQVLEDYFDVLEAVMNKNGDAVTIVTKDSKDGYDVYANYDGKESDTPTLSWENVREAFRFLYSHGQVDLSGNLLVNSETMVEIEGKK